MTHTPGKWQVGGSGSTVFAGQEMVARTVQLTAGRIGEEMANARLIAAAPELLEACKMVMMGFDLAKKTMPVNMRVAVEQFVKPAVEAAEKGRG